MNKIKTGSMQKILLIEDNEALRENTAEILSLASFQVETAENGKVGIEMALKNPPDLIVCDIMMPVLDGYGVYQIISKNDALQHIPFIFLSAKSERSDLRKGMEMGADDYITKPFTDAELINAIKTRLEKVKNLQNRAINNMETWTQIVSELGHKDEMHERLEHHDIVEYKKKQVIYSEGQHPNKLFYIESGKIKIYKSSDSGKELITNLLSPGEFFGYASLIENKVYEEFAETLEESSIRIIPRKEFEELISNNHEIALKVIKLLANNINEKEQQLVALAYHSLRKRVADALLTLKKKYDQENCEHFSIAISREDLANIAGTATESLIRTLSDFKSEKLIEIKDGKITILEEKKLAQLFN
jgi:CRP-like cAMP-binding protein/AmiR/NasT family two-component response regulator